MSDSFQSLALCEVGTGNVADVAAQVSSWLVAQRIAREDWRQTASNGTTALRPGPDAEQVLEAGQPEESGWRDITFNEIHIDPRRTVSAAIQGGAGPVFCPVCGSTMGEDNGVASEFMSAVIAWREGGDGMLVCPSCKSASPITKWQTEPFWAFGNVTVTFWNWPRLRNDFVRDTARAAGYEIKVVRGKI